MLLYMFNEILLTSKKTHLVCSSVLTTCNKYSPIDVIALRLVAAKKEFHKPVYIFGSAISDVLHVLSSPVSGSCILLLVDCCLLIIGTLAANLTAFPMLPSDIYHQFPTNIDKVAFQVGNMGNSIRA
jgi:hypothetical protein